MNEPVRVPVGACRCKGAPHTEDAVYLRPHLSVPMGVAAFAAVRWNAEHLEDQQGAISGVYLRMGITGWTFLDEKLEPIPVTPENIEEMLPFGRGGYAVAEAASALYREDLQSPLAPILSKLSAATSTESSTPPSLPSGTARQKPSKRSSPNGTPGTPSVVPVR